MNTFEIRQVAENEVINKTWGFTEQFLEIHKVAKHNGELCFSRLEFDNATNSAKVYFVVEDARFHLAIVVDTVPSIAVSGVYIEDYFKVYLRATSETLTSAQIKSLSQLSPTKSYNKGDKRPWGKAKYNYSGVDYEFNPVPDTFESKLKNLLKKLEKDKEGVKKLVSDAGAYIQVDTDVYYGNGLIGGPYMNKANIKLMAELNLEIAFSMYVTGNPFR